MVVGYTLPPSASSRALVAIETGGLLRQKPVVQRRRRGYHGGKERVMIELTEQQLQALGSNGATPLHLVNPRTKETFVLLPLDEYQRLKEEEYDDSPWTDEEMEL